MYLFETLSYDPCLKLDDRALLAALESKTHRQVRISIFGASGTSSQTCRLFIISISA
jgi:hypothetical protein